MQRGDNKFLCGNLSGFDSAERPFAQSTRNPDPGHHMLLPIQQKAERGVYDEKQGDIEITCEIKVPGNLKMLSWRAANLVWLALFQRQERALSTE
jgi:hypothetical protein